MSEPAHKSQLEKTQYLRIESSNQRIAKKIDPKHHLGGETVQFRATSEAVAMDRSGTTKRIGRYNVHFSNVVWSAVTVRLNEPDPLFAFKNGLRRKQLHGDRCSNYRSPASEYNTLPIGYDVRLILVQQLKQKLEFIFLIKQVCLIPIILLATFVKTEGYSYRMEEIAHHHFYSTCCSKYPKQTKLKIKNLSDRRTIGFQVCQFLIG